MSFITKTTETGGALRHRAVDLVRERVGLGVVNLVRAELLRPLALLRMPKLMKDRDAAQPRKLPVIGEAPS